MTPDDTIMGFCEVGVLTCLAFLAAMGIRALVAVVVRAVRG